MQSNKRYLPGALVGVALLCLLCAGARAQELEIAVSPSPVGSGARAAGMADAFVAVADDATAASWNPAGLVQLELPEIAIVGSYNSVFEAFSADWHDEVSSKHSDHNIDLNFLSLTYPLPRPILDRNVVAGLYYQKEYDFSRDFSLKFNNTFANNGISVTNYSSLDFKQEGSLSALTPAVAFELTHRLSLGLGVNIYNSELTGSGWEQTMDRRSFLNGYQVGQLVLTHSQDTYDNIHGVSYTAGLLWSVNDKWNIGLRYDSPWTGRADFEGESRSYRINFYGRPPNMLRFIPQRTKEPRDIRFPATWALGAAWRANDRFTLSCDVSRTDWDDFWFKGRNGSRISLVNAANLDAIFGAPDFETTYTVRLGAEYVFVPKDPGTQLDRIWTLRGGLFYDQEPATGAPDDFYGFALGLGLLAHQRVNIDLAYQLRYGEGVNADFIRGVPGFEEDVFQHRVLLSTVIYLK